MHDTVGTSNATKSLNEITKLARRERKPLAKITCAVSVIQKRAAHASARIYYAGCRHCVYVIS